MSSNVKRLLQLAAGEVLGALEDTRGSLGAATSTADHARGVLPAVPGGKAAAGDPVAPNGAGLDLLTEQLRGANAVARALEADKLRLDDELKKVVAQLAECQEHLRDKTAQVCAGLSAPFAVTPPCDLFLLLGRSFWQNASCSFHSVQVLLLVFAFSRSCSRRQYQVTCGTNQTCRVRYFFLVLCCVCVRANQVPEPHQPFQKESGGRCRNHVDLFGYPNDCGGT